MPSLVSIAFPSVQIMVKTQTRLFPISGFLVNRLRKKNCYNFRTSDDIEMKVGLATKLGKRNKTTSKNFAMMS